MNADIRPGQGFVPTILFLDSNGSPVTGATTGTKIGTLTSPSGATLTTGTVTHQGNGRWGFYVAPSFHTASGVYKFTVDQIVSGADSLTGATVTYEVGYDNTWTLREMYRRLREDLNDGFFGTSSGNGSATTLVASAFAYGSDNAWKGSELVLLEPQAVADTNPVRVTAFVASTGTFTFVPAITSTVSGLDFILGNLNGQRWRHDQLIGAITLAVRRVARGAMLTDEDSLTYSTNIAEYVAPASFAEVTALAYQAPSSDVGNWNVIADRYWDWEPDRRRVVFTRKTSGTYGSYANPRRWGQGFDIPQSSRLRLIGTANVQLPSLMGEAIDADGQRVYDLALLHLLEQSPRQDDRQRAAMHAGTMGRPPVRLPR